MAAELLVLPALLAYGEAAVAYGAEVKRPGTAGRLAIWGVRVGWLAHTALLLVQAAQAGGFAWSSWGGALNLLAWLVVGAYLIWGCRPRFRLLGLAVMPLAVALLALALVGGGAGATGTGPGFVLALHVALMLAGFAGFALAGGLSGFYLWHERRLKRRSPGILRLRVPPLESLDRLAGRTVAVALAALTGGMVVGLVGFAVRDAARFDLAMAWTVGVWSLYLAYVLLRVRGLHGRRAAHLALAGLVGVAALLPITHFA
ncbi:MAG TPA: cytochrome c biogenesis protein CcsA [Gaiellaceae bacterium]|nr:cytochrome c biogenesis protein CcsA [Gaiellaceae bacterium]